MSSILPNLIFSILLAVIPITTLLISIQHLSLTYAAIAAVVSVNAIVLCFILYAWCWEKPPKPKEN
jgi:hypothetical protein